MVRLLDRLRLTLCPFGRPVDERDGVLEAEARGRKRAEQEEEASRKRATVLRIVLGAVVAVCLVAGVLFLRQLH